MSYDIHITRARHWAENTVELQFPEPMKAM